MLRVHGGTRRGWGYTEAQEQYIMLQHDGARHREPTRPRRERAALAISRDGPQRWMLTAGLTMQPTHYRPEPMQERHRQIKQTKAPCRLFPPTPTPSPPPPPAPKGTSLKWRASSTAELFPALEEAVKAPREARDGALPSPLPAGKASARPTSQRAQERVEAAAIAAKAAKEAAAEAREASAKSVKEAGKASTAAKKAATVEMAATVQRRRRRRTPPRRRGAGAPGGAVPQGMLRPAPVLQRIGERIDATGEQEAWRSPRARRARRPWAQRRPQPRGRRHRHRPRSRPPPRRRGRHHSRSSGRLPRSRMPATASVGDKRHAVVDGGGGRGGCDARLRGWSSEHKCGWRM